MKIQKIISTFFCYLILSFQPVFATIISASTTNISGNIWESRYIITNDTPFDIKWFAIYFNFDQYENIVYIPTPEIGPDWDIFTAESVLNSDGFVDAFSSIGIAPGQSLTNFVVRYNFLGNNVPGSQNFEVYDFDPDADELIPSPIGRGVTEITTVPEPNILFIFGFGLLLITATRRLTQASIPKIIADTARRQLSESSGA